MCTWPRINKKEFQPLHEPVSTRTLLRLVAVIACASSWRPFIRADRHTSADTRIEEIVVTSRFHVREAAVGTRFHHRFYSGRHRATPDRENKPRRITHAESAFFRRPGGRYQHPGHSWCAAKSGHRAAARIVPYRWCQRDQQPADDAGALRYTKAWTSCAARRAPLYGRNAIGGAILVSTRPASERAGVRTASFRGGG